MSLPVSKPTPEAIEALACYLGVQASVLCAFFAGELCALPADTLHRLENIMQARIEPTLEILPALEKSKKITQAYPTRVGFFVF